jgi:enoyl-CoA hydratase/carnithine racemase
LGLFVGLTGARFSGYDAVAIGMAEGFVRSKKKRDLFAGLSRLGWTLDPAKNKEILRGYLSNEFETDVAGRSDIRRSLETVRRLGGGGSIEEVDRALRNWKGDDPWIERAIASYLAASPTSVKTIFEQMRRGRLLSLKDAFLREWNVALNFCRRSDLFEGARARLIDKDSRPLWNSAAPSAVRDEEIERYFSEQPAKTHPLTQKISAAKID